MLLSTMTPEEAFKEVVEDNLNFQRWANHQSKKYWRSFIKMPSSKRKEASFFGTYISPRKNKFAYCVSYYKEGLLDTVEYFPYIILNENKGISIYRLLKNGDLVIFTPHCLKRINERLKRNMDLQETLKWLSGKSQRLSIVRREEDIKSKIGRELQNSVTIVTDDGVYLSQELNDRVTRHNTFITLDMVRGKQKEVCGDGFNISDEMVEWLDSVLAEKQLKNVNFF